MVASCIAASSEHAAVSHHHNYSVHGHFTKKFDANNFAMHPHGVVNFCAGDFEALIS
ncbi:hypothetical protein [Methanobrevibacter sp.]|uniref:hypothetical protein n=1 Tax=Methanobrevibacter sp. TaxID=66852 RepID=UPI00389014B2